MSNPTPTGQDEARRALSAKLLTISDGDLREYARDSLMGVHPDQNELHRWADLMDEAAELLLASSQDRGAEEWQPIADKPPEADWIVYLPDGAADGLGWALDPDEKLAALLWWEATSPTLSEVTHFRKPIAGPSALAQQAKGEGGRNEHVR